MRRFFSIFAFLLAWISLCEPPAFAERVNGPSMYYDRSEKLKAKSQDSGLNSIQAIKRDYLEVFALFPLKARSLNFMFVPTMRYVESQRTLEFQDGTNASDTWPLLVPGIILVPDFRPLDLRFFAVANRFGSPDFVTYPRHLGEYVVGLDFDGLLQGIKPDFLTVLKARMIYRYRDFPGRKTYLGVGYVDFETSTGWYLSAGYPSHIRIGWKANDESQNAFVEVLGESRNWPIMALGQSYWVDGNNIDRAVGYKFALTEPLYLEFRAGLKTEDLGFYDAVGEKKWNFESNTSPFVSIALKTLFFQ